MKKMNATSFEVAVNDELFDFVHKKLLKCLLRSKTCDFTSVFMTVREIELRVFIFRDIFKTVKEEVTILGCVFAF